MGVDIKKPKGHLSLWISLCPAAICLAELLSVSGAICLCTTFRILFTTYKRHHGKGSNSFLQSVIAPLSISKRIAHRHREENSPLNHDLLSLELERLNDSALYNSFICWKQDGDSFWKFYLSQFLFLLQPVLCRYCVHLVVNDCLINAKKR